MLHVWSVVSQTMLSRAGTGSSISGNSSSSGFIAASSPINPRLCIGSITRRSPSRRMIASWPGSSNSRGIQTAWLRPSRNNLTYRCSGTSRLRCICPYLRRCALSQENACQFVARAYQSEAFRPGTSTLIPPRPRIAPASPYCNSPRPTSHRCVRAARKRAPSPRPRR
jgi:hypothetical protein